MSNLVDTAYMEKVGPLPPAHQLLRINPPYVPELLHVPHGLIECRVCKVRTYWVRTYWEGLWDRVIVSYGRLWGRQWVHDACVYNIGPVSTPTSHRYRELAVKRKRSGTTLLLLLELGLPNELAWPVTAFVCWLGDNLGGDKS